MKVRVVAEARALAALVDTLSTSQSDAARPAEIAV
jgi:hypothetical protein